MATITDPVDLEEAMVGATVIEVKNGEEWVEVTLDNRFVIHFRAGAVIVHPDPDAVS